MKLIQVVLLQKKWNQWTEKSHKENSRDFLGGAVVKNPPAGVSLVAQWLRIRLPMQGTWVRALVREDPTCHGATKPVGHNY